MIKYIIFSLFLFFCSFSNAEDSLLTLKQQLDRLQREVNDLSKSVFASKRDNFEQQEKTNQKSPERTAEYIIMNCALQPQPGSYLNRKPQ